MTTVSFNELVTTLEKRSRFQSSDVARSDFEDAIKEAVGRHNSSYTVTASTSTIPVKEKLPIVLLAWSDLCMMLASQKAVEPSSSGVNGFSTDRDTPFTKLTKLAKELMEQYTLMCQSLGLSEYAGTCKVHQSDVTIESIDLGAQVTFEASQVPLSPKLTSQSQVQADGTIEIAWDEFEDFQNFAGYRLYHVTGSSAIYQAWNYGSSVAPRINNDAALVGNITRMDVKAVRLENLAFASATVNRFLLVVATKSGKYAYSNELVITQT